MQPQTDFDTVITALTTTGTWEANEAHKFVYRPAAKDWAPYRAGQWFYTDYGWTWRGAEANGWATDHYGFWKHDKTWIWVPGGFWLPATVEWLQSGSYLGWRASKLDRFSNPLEKETERYGDPEEWNFVPAEKIRGPLTAKDFVPVGEVKDLLVNAQPVDHVFEAYREIERPGPDPALLKTAANREPVIPVISDLKTVDEQPAKILPKEYDAYRPKFFQDDDGIFRRIELFLNPRAKERNEEELRKLTEQDPDAQKKALEAQKRQEELLEKKRKHEQDLYR